jgi:hypothetical protein
VRDWSSVVRSRLIALGIEAEREEEIRAELAGHLEDAYVDAIRRGCTEEDAVARALERVPDWTRLADAIRRADQKEGPMSPDAKTLWLPGMAALGCAAAVMLGVPRLLPASLWLDPRATMPMTAGLLLSYLAFGALGAPRCRAALAAASRPASPRESFRWRFMCPCSSRSWSRRCLEIAGARRPSRSTSSSVQR